MTVGELFELLKSVPKDTPIVMYMDFEDSPQYTDELGEAFLQDDKVIILNKSFT